MREKRVNSQMNSDPLGCQSATLNSGKPVPKLLDLAYRTRRHYQQYGLKKTAHKLSVFLWRLFQRPFGRVVNPVCATYDGADEVLSLRPGELIEVKSEDEIAATLDSAGKLRGLAFLPSMRTFCGKRFVVLKRVERIYLEESASLRRMKNTVLLDGTMCDGLLMGCDRSCFFYWREAWLRRINNT